MNSAYVTGARAGDYLVLTVLVPEPYGMAMDFVTDCDSGQVWAASNFREPIPYRGTSLIARFWIWSEVIRYQLSWR